MLYQNLFFPDVTNGYYNYDQSIQVLRDPGSDSFYFWSAQFGVGSSTGYMGLQTDTLSNNGQNIGKGFNVALWGSDTARVEAPGAEIRPDTDGEPGRALYMPYEWQEGREYRLRIWQAGEQDGGFWWEFWVLDKVTEVDTHIGDILRKDKSYINNNPVLWTEYYGVGRDNPCDSPVRKPESVKFLNPIMNNDGDRPGSGTLPERSTLNPPGCPNYSIEQFPVYSCIQSVNI